VVCGVWVSACLGVFGVPLPVLPYSLFYYAVSVPSGQCFCPPRGYRLRGHCKLRSVGDRGDTSPVRAELRVLLATAAPALGTRGALGGESSLAGTIDPGSCGVRLALGHGSCREPAADGIAPSGLKGPFAPVPTSRRPVTWRSPLRSFANPRRYTGGPGSGASSLLAAGASRQ